MCGILGVKNYSDQIGECLKKLNMRGRDGVGYYSIDEGWFKSSKVVKDNTMDVPFDDSCKKVFLANSRAVPTTEWQSGAGHNVDNQQPFENDEYVVVHNGIISNDNELREKYGIETISRVDSSLLPDLFSELGVVNGMKEIEGSFAIIAYNKRTGNMYAGTNFMPMVYDYSYGEFICASLKEMIEPLNYKRKGIKSMEPYTCLEVTNNSIEIHSLREMKVRSKVLVICSGGIDSVTTAYVYRYLGYDVTLLHFKYGQAAQEAELYAINKISKDYLGTKPIIMDAVPIFNIFKDVSKLLNQKDASKDEQMLDAETTLSYVPNRNAIFAMIASGIAEMHNMDIVSFGGQQMDSVYPDNNPTFVDAVNKLLPFSLNWKADIKFTAPLIHLMKHEILALGSKIGVPYQYTCSCYYPKVENDEIVHCTKCGCCQFRINAFGMIGVKDTVKYAEDAKLEGESMETAVQDVDKFIDQYVRRWC